MPQKTTHAINNLLANIGLSAELLLRQIPGKLNASQKKYLKNILTDAKKIPPLLKKLK